MSSGTIIMMLSILVLTGFSVNNKKKLKYVLVVICFCAGIFYGNESSDLNAAPRIKIPGGIARQMIERMRYDMVRNSLQKKIVFKKIESLLPIVVKFRTSSLDSTTKVMQVRNDSNDPFSLHIVVESKKKNKRATHTFKVKPGETYEIGLLEMFWRFESGETYKISVADGDGKRFYKQKTGIVP